MKTLLLSLGLALATAPLLAADADLRTQVNHAARNLADQPNYSWSTTTVSLRDGRTSRMGPVEGKTEKTGLTYITGELGETKFEIASHGDKLAVKWGEAWQSGAELPESNAWIARRFKDYKAPAAEVADLVAKAHELKPVEGGALGGALTEAGAKEVFGRWSRAGTEVTGAKGSVKFWLKDGLLVKYEYNLQAQITVNQEARKIDRTTTVDFKDVGKTRLELPAEAKKKLQ
jgi:hypothetical protein